MQCTGTTNGSKEFKTLSMDTGADALENQTIETNDTVQLCAYFGVIPAQRLTAL